MASASVVPNPSLRVMRRVVKTPSRNPTGAQGADEPERHRRELRFLRMKM